MKELADAFGSNDQLNENKGTYLAPLAKVAHQLMTVCHLEYSACVARLMGTTAFHDGQRRAHILLTTIEDGMHVNPTMVSLLRCTWAEVAAYTPFPHTDTTFLDNADVTRGPGMTKGLRSSSTRRALHSRMMYAAAHD